MVEPSGLSKGLGYWVCIWAGLSFQGLSARSRGWSDELTSPLCCLSCYYNEIPEAGHFAEKRGVLSSHVVQALVRACLAASHHRRRQDRSTCVPGRESLGEKGSQIVRRTQACLSSPTQGSHYKITSVHSQGSTVRCCHTGTRLPTREPLGTHSVHPQTTAEANRKRFSPLRPCAVRRHLLFPFILFL